MSSFYWMAYIRVPHSKLSKQQESIEDLKSFQGVAKDHIKNGLKLKYR